MHLQSSQRLPFWHASLPNTHTKTGGQVHQQVWWLEGTLHIRGRIHRSQGQLDDHGRKQNALLDLIHQSSSSRFLLDQIPGLHEISFMFKNIFTDCKDSKGRTFLRLLKGKNNLSSSASCDIMDQQPRRKNYSAFFASELAQGLVLQQISLIRNCKDLASYIQRIR